MQSLFQFDALEKQTIYTWHSNLASFTPDFERLLLALSDDELNRANRYYFEQDRRRFIIGRGILRQLLASALQSEPETINFCYSSTGKPSLASTNLGLHFNLSHSHQSIVWAMAFGQLIGVDIEYLRPLDYLGVAKTVFSSSEYLHLSNPMTEAKQAAFFHIWTQKEAILKMLGDGLGADYLQSLSVESNPNMPPSVLSSHASTIALYPLAVSNGYRACLASEKPSRLVQATL